MPTFTYSDETTGDAAENLKNWARYLLGDTDVSVDESARQIALASDEEYKRALAVGFQRGMVAICTAMLTKLGQQPTQHEVTGGARFVWADRHKAISEALAQAKKGILPVPGEVPIVGMSLAPGSVYAQTDASGYGV